MPVVEIRALPQRDGIEIGAVLAAVTTALAVLLECHRAADAWGKPFELRHAPPKLAALARLYGVDTLLLDAKTVAA